MVRSVGRTGKAVWRGLQETAGTASSLAEEEPLLAEESEQEILGKLTGLGSRIRTQEGAAVN